MIPQNLTHQINASLILRKLTHPPFVWSQNTEILWPVLTTSWSRGPQSHSDNTATTNPDSKLQENSQPPPEQQGLPNRLSHQGISPQNNSLSVTLILSNQLKSLLSNPLELLANNIHGLLPNNRSARWSTVYTPNKCHFRSNSPRRSSCKTANQCSNRDPSQCHKRLSPASRRDWSRNRWWPQLKISLKRRPVKCLNLKNPKLTTISTNCSNS